MSTETLTKPAQTNEAIQDELQLVSFNIGSEEFGVDILKVQEINRMVDITKVPQAPAYVEGVSEVLRLQANTIEPAPGIVTGINAEYIKGVAKLEDRLLIFLELSKVIDIDEVKSMN